MHVLLIDDSPTIRRVLSAFLKNMGFDVVEANDGAEGLARLEDGVRPDVVLLDWDMPTLDGIGFVRRLRADDRHRDLKVLMVTTLSERESIVKALDAGADEYVMKPCTQKMLWEKLQLLGVLGG